MPRVPDNSFQSNTRPQWRAWLRKNHAKSSGVWLITYKKIANKDTVSYSDAVEEALCFGWIDSKPGKLDDERTLWFSPRKPRSAWAGTNKERIERLIAQRLMTPAGMAKIEAAKKDGSWETLTAVEAMVIPPDLRSALQSHKNAAAHFEAFPGGVKRSILQWIALAKRPETRAKRVEETAALAAKNIRANQWTPKG